MHCYIINAEASEGCYSLPVVQLLLYNTLTGTPQKKSTALIHYFTLSVFKLSMTKRFKRFKLKLLIKDSCARHNNTQHL